MKYFFVCLFSLICSASFARERGTASHERSHTKTQVLVVGEDGGHFFKAPNMDAEILAEIAPGTKVRVSKKAFGPSDLPFFLARIQGHLGYIPKFEFRAGNAASKKSSTRLKKEAAEPAAASKDDSFDQSPLYYKNMAGLRVTHMDPLRLKGSFGERETGYGFEINFSGPDWFISGPPIDYGLGLFVPESGFVSSSKKTRGMGAMAHLHLILPLGLGRDSGFFWEFGPHIYYMNFYRDQETSPKVFERSEYKELLYGLSLGGGYGFRAGDAVFKLTPIYYWNKNPFWGISLSVQGVYSAH